MSFTSTLKVHVGKPLQREPGGEKSWGIIENGCEKTHHSVKTSNKVEENLTVNNESPKVEGIYGCPMKNGGGCIIDAEEEESDLDEISRSLSKAVKTSDRVMTVILELCQHSGGGICVHKVKSPVHRLNIVQAANKRQPQDGPLLALLESQHLESTISQVDVDITQHVPTSPERVCETKPPYREERGQEGEYSDIPAPLGTLQKESPTVQHRSPSSSTWPGTAYLKPESVSPKRKPHRSGDTLKLFDCVSHVEAKKGEKVELRCGIRGTPPLAASWVKSKKPVVNGPRISVHTSDTESRLVIQKVCEEDAGYYTLCVQDQAGSIQHQTSLAVVEPPSPPLGKPIISALNSTSLTLSWSGPCYDGGSAVLNYWVEVKPIGLKAEDWQVLADHCVDTTYQVTKGLESGIQYKFRVRAANIYGVSKEGEESDVVTMACNGDVESDYEEPIKYTKVSINSTDRVSDFYSQLEKLGVGKFGQVYKLQEKATGKILAGKFYKTRSKKDLENAKAEVELMNKLHHPRLVHCVDAFLEPGRVVMVMEFIAGGELFERIVADDFEHTEVMCVQYMSQILSGVGYMHKQSIVHLDLKPENIVCVNKSSTRVKIIDFGLAKELAPGIPLTVLYGTPEFVAPEVIAFEPVGFTTDIWSLGVICYILVSGDSPFQGSNDTETLQNVTSACWDFDDETDAVLSDSAKDFIRRLLKKNMRSRLTVDQALDHPWLKDQDVSNTTKLSKERMKKFLARQKWQKTGKAVLALKRMAHLSSKSDTSASPSCTEGVSDSQDVFNLLQEQLQRPPIFSLPLKDQAEVVGSSACLQCNIEGFPDPEVLWFHDDSPVQESSRFQIDYEDTGSCSLVISNVSPSDSGIYTCRALNSHGEAECSAKLTVHTLHAERPRRASTDQASTTG
ncbi:myosin light chain kinase, smooth muscle-like [Pelobates fuscus]|uniref:myosin light chain kinase, smooth muscle-like n=1 Tax=Pelobates fuscus TaxID=191477 RepID=UPI002FE4F0FA